MPGSSNRLHTRLVLTVSVVVCTILIGRDFYPRWVQSRLIQAMRSDDPSGVEAALALGADPNAPLPMTHPERSFERRSVLTQAVQQNSPGVIQTLLRAGARIDAPDPGGHTPLLIAILRRRTEIVSALLDAGADPYREGIGMDVEGKPIRETPMGATHGLPTSLVSVNIPLRGIGTNRHIIYRLLRKHGVVPTLCQAIEIGDLGEVKTLIRTHVDVNQGDESNPPPLYMAIDQGNCALAALLLQAGAKLTLCDSKRGYPLIAALHSKNATMVRLLVEHGARLTYQAPAEQNTLQTAVLEDASPREYRYLRSSGLPPDLLCAVQFGDVATLQQILKSGMRVSRLTFQNKPPLVIAVEKEQEAMVRMLLKAGADPNAGHPLIGACVQHNVEIARELLEAGANVNDSVEYYNIRDTRIFGYEWKNPMHLRLETDGIYGTRVTPIQLAAESNNVAMYQLLRSFHAQTNLFLAVAIGNIHEVCALVEQGADVNALNSMHDTPLTVALMRNQKSVITALLERGASTEGYGSSGDCPLMLAALYGGPDVMNTLIAHGAKVNSVSKSGEPVLMRLAYTDRVDCLRLLLAHGADIDMRGPNGQTVLMCAVRANQTDIVRALLANGVGVNVHDDRGETALHLAVKQHAGRIIACLRQAGARE